MLADTGELHEIGEVGPGRPGFVRHPVYSGQFISQAGVWLIVESTHWVWWSFYGMFIVLKFWRTKREDAVLERAFGHRFREWKERTFWFV